MWSGSVDTHMRVLVAGATGVGDGRLAPALIERVRNARAVVRGATRCDASERIEIAEDGLLNPGRFEAALEGVDAAYYPVHSVRAGKDPEERDRRAAHTLADSASERDVDRAVYLGGLGEETLRHLAREFMYQEPLAIPVLVLIPKLSAYWMGLVTDTPAGSAHSFSFRFKHTAVATDCSTDEFVDVEATPFDEAVGHALTRVNVA